MKKLHKLVFTALCIAFCNVLAFLFHLIPDGGSIFSPMHIPVLICGLICGWQYGIVCGIAGPFISSLISQMPPMAYLPPMMVELAVYGLVAGLCFKFLRTKKYLLDVYISLVFAMIIGRVVAGIAKAYFFMPAGMFTMQMWISSYFVTSLPGIIAHLILIPAIVMALKKAKLIDSRYEEKGFARFLREQYRLHPSMRAQDVHKMCYQAVYGADHLLSDMDAAEKYFMDEFEKTPAEDIPLIEEISAEVCRVNLGAWKYAGLDAMWLFNMFAASVRVKRGSYDQFASYVNTAKRVLPMLDWSSYKVTDNAVHHSEEFRKAEKPAYRIVNRSLIQLIPILKKIDRDTRTIAFEGRAAAGKSTAASLLSGVIGASVIHMDDFFLPPDMRTEERLSEAGGNVHYERFAEEILPKFQSDDAFEYNIFDCSKMELSGKREVPACKIRIVEGAYSLHPTFGDYADIKVFFDVSPKLQMQRILSRNGAQLAEMFEKKWIPLEENYYKEYSVKENADVVVKS